MTHKLPDANGIAKLNANPKRLNLGLYNLSIKETVTITIDGNEPITVPPLARIAVPEQAACRCTSQNNHRNYWVTEIESGEGG